MGPRPCEAVLQTSDNHDAAVWAPRSPRPSRPSRPRPDGREPVAALGVDARLRPLLDFIAKFIAHRTVATSEAPGQQDPVRVTPGEPLSGVEQPDYTVRFPRFQQNPTRSPTPVPRSAVGESPTFPVNVPVKSHRVRLRVC